EREHAPGRHCPPRRTRPCSPTQPRDFTLVRCVSRQASSNQFANALNCPPLKHGARVLQCSTVSRAQQMKARVSRPLLRSFIRPSVITGAKRTNVVYLACVIVIVLNQLSDDPSR